MLDEVEVDGDDDDDDVTTMTTTSNATVAVGEALGRRGRARVELLVDRRLRQPRDVVRGNSAGNPIDRGESEGHCDDRRRAPRLRPASIHASRSDSRPDAGPACYKRGCKPGSRLGAGGKARRRVRRTLGPYGEGAHRRGRRPCSCTHWSVPWSRAATWCWRRRTGCRRSSRWSTSVPTWWCSISVSPTSTAAIS